MKKLLFIISFLILSITAPSAVFFVDAKETIKNFHLMKFKEEINSYVSDVGVKYKYSSRAKDFLTEENLNLIIENCESYPSVIIAMAIIETGWGKYAIGNNYFGIKGRGHVRKTKEWDGTKYITITDSFQQYYSKADNIRAVSDLLHNNKRYTLGTSIDYVDAANKVKRGGYATDPHYAAKIKFIIRKYELYRLDVIKEDYRQLT
jgi:flagellum-specific peptidoglycan hydrolase FlgJ